MSIIPRKRMPSQAGKGENIHLKFFQKGLQQLEKKTRYNCWTGKGELRFFIAEKNCPLPILSHAGNGK